MLLLNLEHTAKDAALRSDDHFVSVLSGVFKVKQENGRHSLMLRP
jgi:hypothetical protein